MNRIAALPKVYLFVVPAVFIAAVILFVVFKVIKLPSTSPLSNVFQKKPTVELKTAYENPFDKETQYINPFAKYKNPFETNR